MNQFIYILYALLKVIFEIGSFAEKMDNASNSKWTRWNTRTQTVIGVKGARDNHLCDVWRRETLVY